MKNKNEKKEKIYSLWLSTIQILTITFISRSPMLSGSEHKDGAEIEETLGTSPPLELRRPASGPRTTITIPHSLQSPQDRATGRNIYFVFIFISIPTRQHQGSWMSDKQKLTPFLKSQSLREFSIQNVLPWHLIRHTIDLMQ